MARDQVDMTPINSRDELVAWFEAGCKPKIGGGLKKICSKSGMAPHATDKK